MEPQAVTGYSVPRLVELDTIPEYALLVGTESGKIYLYRNIDGNLDGAFSLVDTMFLGIWEGIRSAIDFADINNDGGQELIVGNYCGGVAVFKNNTPQKKQKQPEDAFSLKLFPNPVRDNFYINIPEMNSFAEIFLFDVLGKPIFYRKINSAGKYYINVKNFAIGVYYCKLIIDGNALFKGKIVLLK